MAGYDISHNESSSDEFGGTFSFGDFSSSNSAPMFSSEPDYMPLALAASAVAAAVVLVVYLKTKK